MHICEKGMLGLSLDNVEAEIILSFDLTILETLTADPRSIPWYNNFGLNVHLLTEDIDELKDTIVYYEKNDPSDNFKVI